LLSFNLCWNAKPSLITLKKDKKESSQVRECELLKIVLVMLVTPNALLRKE